MITINRIVMNNPGIYESLPQILFCTILSSKYTFMRSNSILYLSILDVNKALNYYLWIVGFEKNIENCSFWLLALKKTSKIVRFDYYTHRPGLTH